MIGLVVTGGNLIGAILTFLYFSYLSVGSDMLPQGDLTLHEILFVAIGTAIIFSTVFWFNSNWSRSLKREIRSHDPDDISLKRIKRKALYFVPMMAGTSLSAWIISGFLFGMIMPVMMQSFFGFPSPSLSQSLRTMFGIICVGGSITTLFIYFMTESLWRKELPKFFPDGDLSNVKGVFKLNVKSRLMIVFLMISLIPLTVLSVSAYFRAKSLLSVDPAIGDRIISGLLVQIIFITAVGIIASVILSLIVSKSVSSPLKEMEAGMKKISRGNLDVFINVVSNDEIGALGEGFNQMLKGLKESEEIKESFGKYISQDIRDEILSGKVSLDGEMKRATILFSDLRNFTPFVESTHPKHVIKIMNQYFSEMAEAIKENRGLILQYIGDEIEAVFGAPVAYDDHPDMAVKAALHMRDRLKILNKKLSENGVAPIQHGIGIHTGAVLAGIIGSKERSSYTLVGDTVNLASRIQGLTKNLSCDILLSRTTHDLITGTYQMEQLPAMKVKGKSQNVMVYKLLGQNGG